MISNNKPIDRITQLIQSGLGRNLQKLPYYRQVMVDPKSAFFNFVYRNYALEIYNNLLNYILNDAQLYQRLRMLLLADQRKLSRKATRNLLNKSEENNLEFEDLLEVYSKGCEDLTYPHLTEEQRGFNAVNSFVANRTVSTIRKVLKK